MTTRRFFHRTSPEAARAILRTGHLLTRENTPDAFVSTLWTDESQAVGYGPVVIEVEADDADAILDDEFGDEGDDDFEQHFRVPLKSRIVGAFTVVDGERVEFTA